MKRSSSAREQEAFAFVSQPEAPTRPLQKAQPPALPEGFVYHPDFLTEQEQITLLEELSRLTFRPFEFQGYQAKRRIVDYGFEYDFNTRKATPTVSIPDFLVPIRERAAGFAELAPADLIEALLTEYPPGAPIGWHRDVPQFEDVIGISLGSACRMRFKPMKGDGKISSIVLEPGSAYLMRGAARWQYQHSIPAVKQLRYSITFRSVRASR